MPDSRPNATGSGGVFAFAVLHVTHGVVVEAHGRGGGANASRHPPGFADYTTFERQRPALARPGRDMRENRNEAMTLKPVDRWLGGRHLQAGVVWRWNGEEQRLAAPA